MPLITCPDCGREVSDRADFCPSCGCPGKYFPDRSKTLSLRPGDIYTMGCWGGEAIEWRVLDVEGSKVLLITDKVIDCVRYNEWHTVITWEECGLRKWCNETFFDKAFTDEEKALIALNDVQNPSNPQYETAGGNAKKDHIFCLSIEEAEKHFGTDAVRRAGFTDLAKKNGVYTSEDGADWWLRTPGNFRNDAAYVSYGGGGYRWCEPVDIDNVGVRPALYLNLESKIF